MRRTPTGTFVRTTRIPHKYGHITGHESVLNGLPARYWVQWEVSQPSELVGRDEFYVIKDQEAGRALWNDQKPLTPGS